MKNKLIVNGKLFFMQSECVPSYTSLRVETKAILSDVTISVNRINEA